MGEIKVTFGAIHTAVSDIQQARGNMDGLLGDLEAYLRPLVADWEGEAASLYQAKKAQWTDAQQNLNQILAQIGTALGQAGEDFQATERANARMWG